MAVTEGLISHLEAAAAETGLQHAAVQYFRGKDEQAVTPEDLALLHYIRSDGEGLPDYDQFAPRLEAAEQALALVAAADIIFVPHHTQHTYIAKVPKNQSRKVTFDIPTGSNSGTRLRASEAGTPLHERLVETYLDLPGIRRLGGIDTSVDAFNLVGPEDDLALPVDTAKGVDSLFNKRRSEVLAPGEVGRAPYLPVILGSDAVSRFVANMGVRVSMDKQHPPSDWGSRETEKSFVDLAQALAAADPELGDSVVDTVRERKPKVVETIQAWLREDLDGILEKAAENGEARWLPGWFNQDTVRLFYTEEQLDILNKVVVREYEASQEAKASQNVADLKKALGA